VVQEQFGDLFMAGAVTMQGAIIPAHPAIGAVLAAKLETSTTARTKTFRPNSARVASAADSCKAVCLDPLAFKSVSFKSPIWKNLLI
jgi:hypothetical protein